MFWYDVWWNEIRIKPSKKCNSDNVICPTRALLHSLCDCCCDFVLWLLYLFCLLRSIAVLVLDAVEVFVSLTFTKPIQTGVMNKYYDTFGPKNRTFTHILDWNKLLNLSFLVKIVQINSFSLICLLSDWQTWVISLVQTSFFIYSQRVHFAVFWRLSFWM